MRKPGLLSCLAETHKPLCSSSHSPGPGQISLTNLSTAQSAQSNDSAHAAGKVKPRMELIFFFLISEITSVVPCWFGNSMLGNKATAAK